MPRSCVVDEKSTAVPNPTVVRRVLSWRRIDHLRAWWQQRRSFDFLLKLFIHSGLINGNRFSLGKSSEQLFQSGALTTYLIYIDSSVHQTLYYYWRGSSGEIYQHPVWCRTSWNAIVS